MAPTPTPVPRQGSPLRSESVAGWLTQAEGALQGIESIATTVVYTYNGDGVRVAQSVDGLVTNWVQTLASHCTSYNGLSNAGCGLPQVLVETTSEETTLYAYGLSRLAQVTGNDAEWFLGDALGSVRQLVDDSGDITLARDYTPYGQPQSESGTGSSGYAFTGEQWDSDVALLFLRARHYAPAVGRFTSKDPLRIEANLYLYAAANPIRFVDPSGYVYVTFDDGPHQNDAKILDILKSHNARATFFFNGENIDLNDPFAVEIVWRVATEGHRLANHAYYHPEHGIPTLCRDETMKSLSDTEYNIKAALLQVKESKPYLYASLPASARSYIDNVIEYGTGMFRPPGGDITRLQRSDIECKPSVWCDQDGCVMVPPDCAERSGPWQVYRWTVDPRDWAIETAVRENMMPSDVAVEMVLDRIKHGWHKLGIIGRISRMVTPSRWGAYGVRSNEDNILLHSWSNPTVEALDDILIWLKSKNYTFDLLEPAWASRSD